MGYLNAWVYIIVAASAAFVAIVGSVFTSKILLIGPWGAKPSCKCLKRATKTMKESNRAPGPPGEDTEQKGLKLEFDRSSAR